MNTWWIGKKNNAILFPLIYERFRKFGCCGSNSKGLGTLLDYDELAEYVKRKKCLERERNKRLRAVASSKEVRRGE